MEVASAATDLAVLNLDVATPDYLSLASTRSTQAGEQVFTVGFPTVNLLGAEAKFTEGSISALSGIRGEASYMQISVPVQPGNSGGPIVNYSGEVLGVVAATAAVEGFYKDTGSLPQNVNWAVKSDFVRPMIDDVPRRSRSTSRASAIERAQKAVCRVSVTY
jgi:S1-C subfamily serine protease